MIARALMGLLAGLALPTIGLAQNCDGDCGPRLGNRFIERLGHFSPRTYPLFESRYIKQFCGPHVSPDSCFGYFKPRVTPWAVACPNYHLAALPITTTHPATVTPAMETPVEPAPTPEVAPKPLPEVPPPAIVPPTGTLPSRPKLETRRGGILPPVAEPDYGPPPLPTIPTVPVSYPRH